MIEISNVSHHFKRSNGSREPLKILDRVSLSIADGEFITFLGPSGCGKTTLLRIVNGLVVPAEGNVIIDDVAVDGPSRIQAMVFQEFNLLPWRTVQKNVEMSLKFQRMPRADHRRISLENIRKVGLAGFEAYYPHQLSGGMKQRVGVARALSISPKYLLMDEPFGALDPQVRELMQIELLKVLEAERSTIIFVTHSVEEAVFLSDRIVIFSARPARILKIVEIGLDKPRWADDGQIKSTAKFIEYRQDIWQLLKGELRRTQEPI